MSLSMRQGPDWTAPTTREFVRSHAGIRIPARGRTYSVNEGNYCTWSEGVKRYVDYLKCDDTETGRRIVALAVVIMDPQVGLLT